MVVTNVDDNFPIFVASFDSGGAGPMNIREFRVGLVAPGISLVLASGMPVFASTTSDGSPVSSEHVVLVGAGDIARCDYGEDETTSELLDEISGTVFTAG